MLGMRIAAFDPHLPGDHPGWHDTQRLAIDELFAASDAISLHVPLTAETRNLMDARRLGVMRSSALLVNAARGGVIDEPALADALRAVRLAGAALDVFAQEPLDSAAATPFRGLSNLLLTPHIAGVTVESNVRVSEVIAAAVLRHLGA